MSRIRPVVPALILATALLMPHPVDAQAFRVRKYDTVGVVDLEDTAPEGAASDGNGRIFANNEGTSTMQVIDEKTMKTIISWPLALCEGPTGVAYDRATDRIFSGCSTTSVVVGAHSGKVAATIANGAGIDALGRDPAEKLIYIPAGRSGNVTIVHQDSADRYSVLAMVETVRGAKTISIDPTTHTACLFQPESGVRAAAGARRARSPRARRRFVVHRDQPLRRQSRSEAREAEHSREAE